MCFPDRNHASRNDPLRALAAHPGAAGKCRGKAEVLGKFQNRAVVGGPSCTFARSDEIDGSRFERCYVDIFSDNFQVDFTRPSESLGLIRLPGMPSLRKLVVVEATNSSGPQA
jgi:hypothetical protein